MHGTERTHHHRITALAAPQTGPARIRVGSGQRVCRLPYLPQRRVILILTRLHNFPVR